MRSTSPDMTTVFDAKPYGSLIEIKSNCGRKKLRRMNQGSNFLGGSFGNGGNVEAPIQFRRERVDFSSRRDPSIFTSIAPELLHQSNKIS